MNLRERLENSIIGFSVVVVVATTTIVYAVMSYFNNKEIELLNSLHKNDIQKLESNILSIERNIGDEKYFDIRNFIYGDDQNSHELEFIPKGEFYAKTKIDGFTFKEYSEIDLIKRLFNISQAEIESYALSSPELSMVLSQKYSEISIKAPIYCWLSNDSTIYWNGEEEAVSFQYMTVQILTNEILLSAVNLAFDLLSDTSDIENQKNELEKSDIEFMKKINSKDTLNQLETQDLDNYKHILENMFENDIISIYFYYQLKLRLNSLTNNKVLRIEKLQKLGNVLYMKSRTKLTGCNFNGKDNLTFYKTEELFLISTGKNFYIVRSEIPGFEPIPIGEKVAKLNIWLNDLKFQIN